MSINSAAFSDPQNWMRAEGIDPDTGKAVIGGNGNVLFYAKTGGMMSPKKHRLEPGTRLYRFGSSTAEVSDLMQGSWWLEQPEFSKLLSFSQQKGLSAAVSMRILALVPPQWSDMGKLIRVTVAEPLLAMRGLADNVVVPTHDGLGDVRLNHHNDIAARRLHQLFIPGLRAPGMAQRALSFGNIYDFSAEEAMRGFLYL